MTNRALKRALLDKLHIQAQGLSKRVQKKKALVPMSTAEATYLIAHEAGIKIDRYLTPDEVARVRALHVPKTHVTPAAQPETRRGRRAHANKQPRELRFPSDFKVSSPLLDSAKLSEALSMARVYPVLYVIENSIRELIKRVMRHHFGDGWWDTELTKGRLKGVHETAAARMASEKRNSWHQKRGAHPIDYVDIDDLETIIQGHRDRFVPLIIPELPWFEHFMKELYPSRNVVAHMNPLTDDNVTHVELKLRQWEGVLRGAGAAIPSA